VLDLDAVDLSSLCEALEDHTWEHEWWLDPKSGKVEIWLSNPDFGLEVGEEHPADRDCIRIEPAPSGEGYHDMEDFIERVRDTRARDLLERAIGGRGAFRRFKDTLLEFPELREAWFRFHDARTERRAIEWLADARLVAQEEAESAIESRPDPELPELSGSLDAAEIARRVAGDLRELYGDRLRAVLLFGSWARGDAHPESDIDLLVVLDHVASASEEHRRMDEVLWRHSFTNDTVVSALVVAERDFVEPRIPAVIRARVEGRVLA
jgi:predicted nucleotidyltransferase